MVAILGEVEKIVADPKTTRVVLIDAEGIRHQIMRMLPKKEDTGVPEYYKKPRSWQWMAAMDRTPLVNLYLEALVKTAKGRQEAESSTYIFVYKNKIPLEPSGETLCLPETLSSDDFNDRFPKIRVALLYACSFNTALQRDSTSDTVKREFAGGRKKCLVTGSDRRSEASHGICQFDDLLLQSVIMMCLRQGIKELRVESTNHSAYAPLSLGEWGTPSEMIHPFFAFWTRSRAVQSTSSSSASTKDLLIPISRADIQWMAGAALSFKPTLAAIRKIKDWPWTFVDLSLDSNVVMTFIQGARARMDNRQLLEDFNRQFVNLRRQCLETHLHAEDDMRRRTHWLETVNSSNDHQSSPARRPYARWDFTGTSSDHQGSHAWKTYARWDSTGKSSDHQGAPAWKTYAWWDSTMNSSNHQGPPARATSARCDSYRHSRHHGNSPLPRADARWDPQGYSREHRISPLRPKDARWDAPLPKTDAWWDPQNNFRDRGNSPPRIKDARWDPDKYSRERGNSPLRRKDAWWDPEK